MGTENNHIGDSWCYILENKKAISRIDNPYWIKKQFRTKCHIEALETEKKKYLQSHIKLKYFTKYKRDRKIVTKQR